MAVPRDDAMVALAPNMDGGGQDPVGQQDGGNVSISDAGVDAQVPQDGRPVLTSIAPAWVVTDAELRMCKSRTVRMTTAIRSCRCDWA